MDIAKALHWDNRDPTGTQRDDGSHGHGMACHGPVESSLIYPAKYGGSFHRFFLGMFTRG